MMADSLARALLSPRGQPQTEPALEDLSVNLLCACKNHQFVAKLCVS